MNQPRQASSINPARRAARALASAACALILPLGASPARVQAAADAAPSRAANEAAETVVLPEFNVTTSPTNDYVAAETITGTRIASKILELPFNVNVATSEFMEDFSLRELNDQIGFISSTIPAEGRALPGSLQSSVTIRGFAADVDLRDGFRRPGGQDGASIDRIEVIKGPAAGIYGRIQPGGVVNVITKKPQTVPGARLSVSAGDFAQRRIEASSTGPLAGSAKFFYRVDLDLSSRGYKMKYRETDVENASAQLLWKIGADSSLNFELEHSYRHELPGSNAPMIVRRGLTDPYQIRPDGTPAPAISFYEAPAMELLNFNNVGPGVWTDLETNTFTLTYDNRLSSTWALRAGLNFFDRLEERQFLSNTATLSQLPGSEPDFTTIYTTTSFGPGNTARFPDYNWQDEYGYNFQADLVGAFQTGPVNHRLLISVDATRDARRKKEYQMFVAAANNPAYNGFALPLSVANPNYAFENYLDAPQLYGARAQQHYFNSDNTYGLFVSERAAFFHDRLFALVGARYDYAHGVRDLKYVPPGDLAGAFALGNAAQYSDFNNDNVTYQAGLNFALTPGTMLYASRSTSYQPISLINNSGAKLPNETGVGTEGGVKLSWFQNRLNLTLSYYEIVRRNLADTVLIDVENNISDVFATGEQRSRGIETDLNWQLSPGFQLFGGFGHNNTRITKNETQRFLINTNPRRSPDTNLGLGVRYEVQSGTLKGLYFTVGLRHYSSSVALSTGSRTLDPNSYVIVNRYLPNGVLIFPQFPEGSYIYRDVITVNGQQTIKVNKGVRVSVDNGQSAIRNPPYTIEEAAIGYRWRGGTLNGRPVEHRIQINLKNITDEDYAVASLRAGEPRSYLATYTLNY